MQLDTFTLGRSFGGHRYQVRLDWMSHEEQWGVSVRVDGELQALRQEDGDPWQIMQAALAGAVVESDDGLGDG